MIALDTNSNALPPPAGSGSSGPFGTGLEQANPLNGLPLTMRGGNDFDTGSLAAKPLIRFNLGPTANLHLDPTLPYFLELTTQTDANSNDTFRIYSITDSATRSFNEATLTWNNAPAVATASKLRFRSGRAGNGDFLSAEYDRHRRHVDRASADGIANQGVYQRRKFVCDVRTYEHRDESLDRYRQVVHKTASADYV